MSKARFYADGLHFECTGCGNCCKLAGGFVYVTDDEIKAMSEHLKLSLTAFTDKYLEIHKNRYVLKSRGDACILLENEACIVYPARPVQCRTFPFWPSNLKSKYRWKMTQLECEGIGKGRLYSQSEIEHILKTRDATDAGPAPSERVSRGSMQSDD
ncbi:MAG: YkgJ family cysteine cluster protein [Candidatus Marinimicrobia bacterium]|nr:YkgJ family cysteine cluster protein [Candidatus Neomarinimicrobiota bacterium]MCF7839888.1 YkgJ family cysteine cluster protein [Candidatus Neomarinimicrobiota bacterium]MCF7902464.1 YkgJ family cysteine cluster protein [Candidatus Neomarinimicrobiota bacterium]